MRIAIAIGVAIRIATQTGTDLDFAYVSGRPSVSAFGFCFWLDLDPNLDLAPNLNTTRAEIRNRIRIHAYSGWSSD